MTVKVEFSINTVELEVKYLYNHIWMRLNMECGGNLFAYVSKPI